MKSVKCCLAILLIGAIAMAQSSPKIPLIGERAPEFYAQSTQGPLNFPGDFGSHWKLIVSFPIDFNPVCSSELLELACKQDEFKALNVDVLVLSTDSMEKHHLWIKSLEELCYKKQNTRDIDIPLLTDYNYRITRKFGMLHHPYSSNKDIRGVFLIDPENTVRFVQFYPVEIGQNIEELKRVTIALQKADEEKIFTPANWQPGEDVLLPCPKSCAEPDPNINQLSWYMTFQKQPDLNAPDLASKEKIEKQGKGVNPIIE